MAYPNANPVCCSMAGIDAQPHFFMGAMVNVQRRQLLQLALLGMAATLFPGCRNGTTTGVEQGSRFPDVNLPYLDGRAALFAVLSGVPLVVNFWASWCEPCRQEMPSLEKLSTLFSAEDLSVVGISVDSDINLAREFSLHYKPTFQMLSDSNQMLSKGVLQIQSFPVTYLLRRDRTIARVVTGARDWADSAAVRDIEESLAVRRLPAT